MNPLKEVRLTMADIKELNACLQQRIQENHQQVEAADDVSQQSLLREKGEFLEQIMSKLNG